MSARNNYFKIGLFVLTAFAILVAGLLAFGARGFFQEKLRFETAIEGEVQGLSVGSAVELRGVRVGRVTFVGFSWNEYPESGKGFVIVRFQIEKGIMPQPENESFQSLLDARIKMGLRAVVKGQGITGISIVSLEYLNPANNPPPQLDFRPRHFYIPSAPSTFTRLLDSIESSLHNLQKVDFAGISEGITNALGSIHVLAGKLDQLDFRKLTTNADALLVELKGATTSLKLTLDEVRSRLEGMQLEAIGKNADGLLIGLRESNTKLQVVLDHLGTVPLRDTVGDIRQAVDTLNGVLWELKQYPSGFLFGRPPPPAQSVQPIRNK